MTNRIVVSQAVKDAFEEVRDMGVCNMRNHRKVQAAMRDLGHFEGVVWIWDNRCNYDKAIMHGLTVDDSQS